MLELTLFLAAQWLLGRLFRQYGAPAVLAEILVGVVLGPELLNIVPFAIDGAKDACLSSGMRHMSILVLIGNMGVALMIFESGMHLHFDKVAEVGKDAPLRAVDGSGGAGGGGCARAAAGGQWRAAHPLSESLPCR